MATLPVTVSVPGYVPQTVQLVPVPPANAPPKVAIQSPSNGATFAPGVYIQFVATATDAEDGTLPATSLTWNEGTLLISHGLAFQKKTFTPGPHTLTFSAVDSNGAQATATVSFTIGEAPVVPPVVTPPVVVPPVIIPPISLPGDVSNRHEGTAKLPLVTPTITASNATMGTTHSPANSLALAGTTFVAGHTYILADNTCYNDATRKTITLPDMASETLLITSNTARLCSPGNGRTETDTKLTTPHFQAQDTATTPLRIGKNWRLVGIEVDEGVANFQGITCRIGPINEPYDVLVAYTTGQWAGAFQALQNNAAGSNQNDPTKWRRMLESDLATGVKLDRCCFRIKAFSATSSQQIAVYAAAKDFAAIGCLFLTEGGTGAEDKGFLSVTGGAGHLFKRCTFISSAIPMLTGGSGQYFDTIISDMTFSECYFFRPLRMIKGTSEYTADGSQSRISKNLFELKMGRRVLVERCKLENHYDPGSAGAIAQSQYYAVVFKVSTYSTSFGTETCDVTFRWNELKNINGFVGHGWDVGVIGGILTANIHDVSIYQNWTSTKQSILCSATGGSNGNSWGNLLIQTGMKNIYFGHNTCIVDDSNRARAWQAFIALNLPGIVYDSNVINWGDETYGGMTEAGQNNEKGKLLFTGAGSTIRNVICYDPTSLHTTQSPSNYTSPTPFLFSSGANAAAHKASIFVDYDANDFRVIESRKAQGFGGSLPGADIDTIKALTRHCVDGLWV